MRIREGEGRQGRGGGCWCRWFEMAGRDGTWEVGARGWDLREVEYRDGDGISERRGCALGKSGNTTTGEHTKWITTRQRRPSAHTPTPLTDEAIAKQRKKKYPLATYKIYINTPPSPLYPDLPPHNPLLNSSPNTNIPYVASADSATGIGLRPLSARGIDDPPSTTDASSASSTPSDSEFWMRMPPRASVIPTLALGRWEEGKGVGGHTEQPDRHAGNNARLAARLDEADDAAAGGQRGEDVGGEFEALGEGGGVSARPVFSTRARGVLKVCLTIADVVLVLLVVVVVVATGSIAKEGEGCARRFVMRWVGCVDDDVDVLSFLFLELSDLGGEAGGGASPNDEPSWSFPSK